MDDPIGHRAIGHQILAKCDGLLDEATGNRRVARQPRQLGGPHVDEVRERTQLWHRRDVNAAVQIGDDTASLRIGDGTEIGRTQPLQQ